MSKWEPTCYVTWLKRRKLLASLTGHALGWHRRWNWNWNWLKSSLQSIDSRSPTSKVVILDARSFQDLGWLSELTCNETNPFGLFVTGNSYHYVMFPLCCVGLSLVGFALLCFALVSFGFVSGEFLTRRLEWPKPNDIMINESPISSRFNSIHFVSWIQSDPIQFVLHLRSTVFESSEF